MAKILLVEDDANLADKIKFWFSQQGDQLEHASTGEDGLHLLGSFSYDIVLLDWTLPGITGLEVCKRYRKSGGTTPIIFLTGRNDIESKEQGLDLGADDYVVKPFDARELSARIRSILRRPTSLLPSDIRIGEIVLEPKTRTLTVNGASHHLMPRESALLEYLMRHPNRIFGSKELLDAVWSSESDTSTETVRSWMRNLRNKLSAAGVDGLIKTVPGSGYIIEFNQEKQ
jgi:OmpR-family two-component system manganese-sensing response regulator